MHGLWSFPRDENFIMQILLQNRWELEFLVNALKPSTWKSTLTPVCHRNGGTLHDWAGTEAGALLQKFQYLHGRIFTLTSDDLVFPQFFSDFFHLSCLHLRFRNLTCYGWSDLFRRYLRVMLSQNMIEIGTFWLDNDQARTFETNQHNNLRSDVLFGCLDGAVRPKENGEWSVVTPKRDKSWVLCGTSFSKLTDMSTRTSTFSVQILRWVNHPVPKSVSLPGIPDILRWGILLALTR